MKKIGDKGIRTPDLTGAIRALYQLSYVPTTVSHIGIIIGAHSQVKKPDRRSNNQAGCVAASPASADMAAPLL
jgi:hypothetical protein